jgi:hypothetical protein
MRARVLLLVAFASVAPAAVAGEGGARRADPPLENVSYVPADDPIVRRAFQTAGDAAAAGDAVKAVRALQGVVDAAPSAVVAVGEDAGQCGAVEGVRVVAHHPVFFLGAAVAAAYEAEYGARATELLDRAVARLDRSALAEAFDRYAPTEAGRRAALLLTDLALERGDVDEALGWLDRLEDLLVAAPPDDALTQALARWRDARVAREARARRRLAGRRGWLRARLATLDPLARGSSLVGGSGDAAVRPPTCGAPRARGAGRRPAAARPATVTPPRSRSASNASRSRSSPTRSRRRPARPTNAAGPRVPVPGCRPAR